MKKIQDILKERILIIDGAMGTMIQRHTLEEADFRGEKGDRRDMHSVTNRHGPTGLELELQHGQARGRERVGLAHVLDFAGEPDSVGLLKCVLSKHRIAGE